MTRRYHLLAIVLLVVAGLVLFRQGKISGDELSERAESGGISQPPAGSPDIRDDHLVTKARMRNPQRSTTREETARLVQKTVLPVVELPDQTLGERVKELNRMVRECGVDPGRLALVMDPDGSRPDQRLSDFRCEEMRIHDLPLDKALAYIKDSTMLNYQVVAGRVEFFLHDSVRDIRWRNDVMNARKTGAEEAPSVGDPFGEVGKE